MRIRRVEHFDAISPGTHDWNRMSSSLPFLSREWLGTWWDQYGSCRELFLLVGSDDEGNVMGVAPFWRQRRLIEGNALCLLGNGEVCSDYVSLLTTPEFAPEFVTSLADWLVERADSREDGWNFIDLDVVSCDDHSWQNLFNALERLGCSIQQYPVESCWRLSLPSSWDEYLAAMSKNRRKQLRRIERDWYESGRAVQRVIEDPRDLNDGLEHLFRLHQLRRQSLGQTGCFASPPFTRFLRDVAGQMLSVQSLRLYVLELDGQIAAAEFALKSHGTTFLYQGGFDPALAKCSPGQISTLGMIRHAIEQGCHAFDFLRGDEDYKARWRAEPISNHRVRIIAPSMAARVRDRFIMSGYHVKSWLKGLSPCSR